MGGFNQCASPNNSPLRDFILKILLGNWGRDLFKKTRDTKGTFYAKMGSIKDRNGTDLTEAEDIKKRWQEYIELYKTCLNTQITMKVWRLT